MTKHDRSLVPDDEHISARLAEQRKRIARQQSVFEATMVSCSAADAALTRSTQLLFNATDGGRNA